MWLNYQIEHHVFPDLPMRQYRIVQPKLKAICEKYEDPYAQGGVVSRVKKMIDVLSERRRCATRRRRPGRGRWRPSERERGGFLGAGVVVAPSGTPYVRAADERDERDGSGRPPRGCGRRRVRARRRRGVLHLGAVEVGTPSAARLRVLPGARPRARRPRSVRAPTSRRCASASRRAAGRALEAMAAAAPPMRGAEYVTAAAPRGGVARGGRGARERAVGVAGPGAGLAARQERGVGDGRARGLPSRREQARSRTRPSRSSRRTRRGSRRRARRSTGRSGHAARGVAAPRATASGCSRSCSPVQRAAEKSALVRGAGRRRRHLPPARAGRRARRTPS